MKYEATPIISRIQWCRRQQQDSLTQDERAGWRAEEAGLVDALGSRDRIAFMRKEHGSYFHRYQGGFEDGQSLLRLSTLTPYDMTSMTPVKGLGPAPVTTPSRASSRPIEGNSSMYRGGSTMTFPLCEGLAVHEYLRILGQSVSAG